MDNVECPICLVKFSSLPNYADNALHPAVHGCPLSNYEWPVERWNMRPPKKEQPKAVEPDSTLLYHLADEVLWLRSMLEKTIIEEPTNYSISYDAKTGEWKKKETATESKGAGE